MVLFIILCFVGAFGTFTQKMWGYVISILVSLGFIVGANGLNAWIPTLLNPHDYNTFIVAVTIVPVLVLVAALSILCLVNRKKDLSQIKYLARARSFSGAFTVAIAILMLAGAISGASIAASASSTAGTPVSVAIVTGAFNPTNAGGHFASANITVVIGVNNTVVWTNDDYTIHTVTSDQGIFDSGLLNNGNTWSYTFSSPGIYGYHCVIHPFMKGTVVVEAKS